MGGVYLDQGWRVIATKRANPFDNINITIIQYTLRPILLTIKYTLRNKLFHIGFADTTSGRSSSRSLFCLTTPLEHIDFYLIIGYWASFIWSR